MNFRWCCILLTLAFLDHARSAEVLDPQKTVQKVAESPDHNQASTRMVYTEGGAVLNVSNAHPEVHATVRKRILSDAEIPAPAPVVDNILVPINATTAKNVPSVSLDKPSSVANITSTSTIAPVGGKLMSNSTSVVLNNNSTNAIVESSSNLNQAVINGTIPATTPLKAPVNVTLTSTTTSTTTVKPSTTSSSTTTTTTTTTSTTTPKPKKPTLTKSVIDDPSIVHIPSAKTMSPSLKQPPAQQQFPIFHNNLDVEEPIAQLSRENLYSNNNMDMDENHRVRNSRRDLVIPVVSLIFTIPMLLGLATIFVRKFRDYWHTRHYRRMDFLVDGIYND